ncbi:MAG: hypothetical protein JO189_15425 [Deltaproteobacteria bacterium]|nr:hypothetical protein [Deltaproteobacteria bacterium]
MSPEFIAIIIFGTVQLAGLLILDLMLREISVSTRIHVLQGRRIEEVLGELARRGA